jgi:hypothetical protein
MKRLTTTRCKVLYSSSSGQRIARCLSTLVVCQHNTVPSKVGVLCSYNRGSSSPASANEFPLSPHFQLQCMLLCSQPLTCLLVHAHSWHNDVWGDVSQCSMRGCELLSQTLLSNLIAACCKQYSSRVYAHALSVVKLCEFMRCLKEHTAYKQARAATSVVCTAAAPTSTVADTSVELVVVVDSAAADLFSSAACSKSFLSAHHLQPLPYSTDL